CGEIRCLAPSPTPSRGGVPCGRESSLHFSPWPRASLSCCCPSCSRGFSPSVLRRIKRYPRIHASICRCRRRALRGNGHIFADQTRKNAESLFRGRFIGMAEIEAHVGGRALGHEKMFARREQHAFFARTGEKRGGIDAQWQLQPEEQSAGGDAPRGDTGEM